MSAGATAVRGITLPSILTSRVSFLTAMIVIDETIQRGVPKGNEWKKLNLQSHTEQQSAVRYGAHMPLIFTSTEHTISTFVIID